MDGHRQNLEEAVLAVNITSPTSYSWFGEPSLPLPIKLRRELNSQEAREYLLNDLTSRLYSDFYARGRPTPSRAEANIVSPVGLTRFVAELSAANSGSGYWEDGWKVRTVEGDIASVFRGGLTIWVPLKECLVAEGGSIVPEGEVHVRFAKEFLGMSPGFYMAVGDHPLIRSREQVVIRLYWNLTSDGAISFIGTACKVLNRAALPFRLKVLNDRSLFSRCDGGVIYVLGSNYPAVADALSAIYETVGHHLKSRTPAFTKQLAPGVGLAEDPGQGESFGQHRCQLLADAVIRAYEEGKKSDRERIKGVSDSFEAQGISITRPFLNPGSKEEYEPLARAPSGNVMNVSKTDSTFGAFLDTADELGRRLSKEALWHENRCNWLGAQSLTDFQNGGAGPVYKPLDATLYSGTSGVALFLAELYVACGSSEVRGAAVGAIQHALKHPPKNGFGLYTGTLGVTFAASRVGVLINEEEFLERASHLIHECVNKWQAPIGFDLLSGRAGAIVGFLLLREMLQNEDFLEIAVRCADELLQSAEDSPTGSSWRSPTLSCEHNLTGFSHGTAGVGYAFLELFNVTRDAKYRAAAERAFEYERYRFDAEKFNWPDFRSHRNGDQRRGSQRFATFWCHGAPGIGLSRLRAYEILADERCKKEGIVALKTTHGMLQSALTTDTENFSLCHGLAGNAEVLLYGRQVLGPKWADASALAEEIAKNAIHVSKKQGGAWRCGIDRGETPALMLGLAGIGYFYLRLHNPGIPSILMLRREDFRRKRR